ncbi:MAG: 3'(2'),5'-bisphosphate nucleotidase CysQ [Candidatus Woesearchaeota archaeon]
MEYETELAISYDAVISASKLIRELYDSFSEKDVAYKDDDSPLTRADTEANRLIISELAETFPKDGILSEEHDDDKSRLEKGRVWVVDPLDGTKEFIKKNGEFTVNVALVVDGQPVIGVIGIPAKHQVYYAVAGEGAFFIDSTGVKAPIKISSESDVSKMTLAKSRSHASDKLQDIAAELGIENVIASGSSVKGCLVASGDAEVYIRLGPTHEWDVCAMHAIVAEAGGVMTDLVGSPITYNHENTLLSGFVVSNGKAHDKILEAIK